MESLAPALSRLSQLQALELSRNRIGDRGAAALAAALPQLTALTLLHLTCNAIGDIGMMHLVPPLARLPSLHRLCCSLRGNDPMSCKWFDRESALQAGVPAGVWTAFSQDL